MMNKEQMIAKVEQYTKHIAELAEAMTWVGDAVRELRDDTRTSFGANEEAHVRIAEELKTLTHTDAELLRALTNLNLDWTPRIQSLEDEMRRTRYVLRVLQCSFWARVKFVLFGITPGGEVF